MATCHPLYLSCAWRRLSQHVRMERAMGRCEHCGVSHGAISANGRSIIYLGCAHLNGDRYDFRPENLRALCPQCHSIYDELSRLILAQRPAGRAVSPPRDAR
jgi:Zn finger protein HypA/HybF involved in hydrogenase expression